MYLPRWVAALLFMTSVLSTGAVMFLLVQKSSDSLSRPIPQATVIISPVPTAVVESAVATPKVEEMMANAKWLTKEQKELSIKIDYPENWVTKYENNELTVSNPTSMETSVVVSRRDKKNKNESVTTIVGERKSVLEKTDEVGDMTTSTLRVDDAYDGTLLKYTNKQVPMRELLFATRGYVYSVLMTGASAQQEALFSEILKSIDII